MILVISFAGAVHRDGCYAIKGRVHRWSGHPCFTAMVPVGEFGLEKASLEKPNG